MKTLLITIILIIEVRTYAQVTNETHLEGVWNCTEFVEDGTVLLPEKLKNIDLVIHGDNYLVYMGDVIVKAKFKIFTNEKINRLEITPSIGLNQGKTFYGTYQLLNPNELIIRYTNNAKDKVTATVLSKSRKDSRYARWKRVIYQS